MRVPEEEVGELDKPPSTKSPIGRHAAPWRVALLANLKSDVHFGADAPPDAGAEFDRQDTVEAIAQALEADGHWVTFLPADHTLPDSLHRLRPHICFNISEGLSGDAREAQVPALCELLAIPYTGSRVMANSLSLEKTLTKRIWRDHGLPTARFQEFTSSEDPLDPELRLPPAGSGGRVLAGPRVHRRVHRQLRGPAAAQASLALRLQRLSLLPGPGDRSLSERDAGRLQPRRESARPE